MDPSDEQEPTRVPECVWCNADLERHDGFWWCPFCKEATPI